MRVLGLSGSLRRDSHNARLLRAAASALPPGAELVPWTGLADVPPYSEDDDHAGVAPLAVASLKRAVAEADALLVATPEYNHSLPGQLKNALDWLSRPIATNPARGKPAAVIGTSTGAFGAVWAQAEGRKVLGALGARVLDEELPVPYAAEAFAPDADLLADPAQAEALAALLARLAEAAEERAAA